MMRGSCGDHAGRDNPAKNGVKSTKTMAKMERRTQMDRTLKIRVMTCQCSHESQDWLYGLGSRVFNRVGAQEGDTQRKWRCTVCGRIRTM